ncbi:hypothetical protein KIN20_026993 [Parelaphostrongylus tenuis]|uniref:Uncharacterized protein n=1 Tax=Parelaphostrongylus tenuis TaxID=148309 RepID=A0AAD5WDN6_PARTN|nr:hypothetical protein KIN20_026993 [Parelaphostrongylus tenuis]
MYARSNIVAQRLGQSVFVTNSTWLGKTKPNKALRLSAHKVQKHNGEDFETRLMNTIWGCEGVARDRATTADKRTNDGRDDWPVRR